MRLVLLTALALACLGAAGAQAQDRTLSLYNTHTHERLTVTYKRNGRFVQAGLDQLNRFLRDWRRDEVTRMDPELFDLVWQVYRDVRASEPIHVVSAYRSPATNNMLRSRSSGVAQNSNHTRGLAMDFFIPGVSAADIRAAGLRLQQGGVGYYPGSATPFVHLDTGSIRMWPRMTRDQLARVFPDGRTVHIPSDGRPMSGFELAQRDLQRGTSGSRAPTVETASERSAQSDGDGDIVLPGESGGGFLSALFGGDREEAPAPAPAAVAAAQPQPASPPASQSAEPAVELASAPRDRFTAPSPVLPPYASPDGTWAAPSTIAGLVVPSPTPAPTIDDIQLAALGTPAPVAAAGAIPGAAALDSAFAVAQSAPAAPSPAAALPSPALALAAAPLPPINRAEQIAQSVPAPGQIAAIIEARFAEQRAAQASLAGRVSEALEVASAPPAPTPSELANATAPRFIPPVPLAAPANLLASAAPVAPAPITLASAPAAPSGNSLIAAAFAAQQETRTPAQSAIDILTGSARTPVQAGITGRLYPIADDLAPGLAKQSIRGAQHATLVAPSDTVSLSPILIQPSSFVPSSTFQLRTDGFSRTGS